MIWDKIHNLNTWKIVLWCSWGQKRNKKNGEGVIEELSTNLGLVRSMSRFEMDCKISPFSLTKPLQSVGGTQASKRRSKWVGWYNTLNFQLLFHFSQLIKDKKNCNTWALILRVDLRITFAFQNYYYYFFKFS